MLQSVRSILQMFPNNDMELSSTAEPPKHVISGNGNGNGQIKNKKYSDYLLNGIPIWKQENRGMNDEEPEAFKDEVARLGREKAAGDLRL